MTNSLLCDIDYMDNSAMHLESEIESFEILMH